MSSQGFESPLRLAEVLVRGMSVISASLEPRPVVRDAGHSKVVPMWVLRHVGMLSVRAGDTAPADLAGVRPLRFT